MTDLPLVNFQAVLFFLFIVFIVRPVAVFLSTRSAGLVWQERLFLSFMAPRGIVAAAVASLFSERLVAAGFPEAGSLVIIVFFLVSATVIFYALVSPVLAHVLKLARPRSSGMLVFGASKFAIELSRVLKGQGADVVLVDRNSDQIRAARAQGLEAVKEDIFSEEVLDLVEERGLGRLLALTQNAEANSLAIEHFRHLMDPGELYQLTTPSKSKLRQGHHLVGRFLFDEKMNFRALEEMAGQGPIVGLSSAGDGAGRPRDPVLFSSDGKGKIVFCTSDHEEAAVAGKEIFGFRKAGGSAQDT